MAGGAEGLHPGESALSASERIRSRAAENQLGTLAELGIPISPGATVVDLGCGAGTSVAALRADGYDAIGCDIDFKPGPHRDALVDAGLLRRIEMDPYRLPFDDASVDLLVSEQVLEHVADLPPLIRETARILRPDGYALHVYPATLRPKEPHVHVPFGGVFQSRGWLDAWARVGIRTPRQRGLDWRRVAEENDAYLSARTNYLTSAKMRSLLGVSFERVDFVEWAYLAQTRRGAALPRLIRRYAGAGTLYRHFAMRAVLCSRPIA